MPPETHVWRGLLQWQCPAHVNGTFIIAPLSTKGYAFPGYIMTPTSLIGMNYIVGSDLPTLRGVGTELHSVPTQRIPSRLLIAAISLSHRTQNAGERELILVVIIEQISDLSDTSHSAASNMSWLSRSCEVALSKTRTHSSFSLDTASRLYFFI